MISGDLGTTNMWLAIMAIVSLLEALLLIGIGVGGFLVYRRVMQLVNDLEARQIAPVREKVDAILGDVKAVTARVSQQTERVNHAIYRHHGARRRDRRPRDRLGARQGQPGGRHGARHPRHRDVGARSRRPARAAGTGRGPGIRSGSRALEHRNN